MKSAFVLLLSGLNIFIISCGDHSKTDIRIDENTFVTFYSEMLITAEMYRSDSSAYRARIDSLTNALHITGKQIQNTIRWYTNENKRWAQFYEKVLTRMEARVREYELKH